MTLKELDKYSWTGHAVIAGKYKAPWQSQDEVLAHFGTDKRKAIMAYRRYLQDGWSIGKQERLTGGGLRRIASLPADGRENS